MKRTWYLFYNFLVIPLLYVSLKVLGIFNSKVKKGLQGRKRIFEDIIIEAAGIDKSKKLVWFHSSSLGEFEQAKPIIEELKSIADINILVTFFSPSGYENSKKYPFADIVTYIPFDTVSRAENFIRIVRPDLAIIMRYDIWPNHVWALKKAGIPAFLVDATMKKDSMRKFFLVKNFHKNLFKNLTRILTVSESDANGFKEFDCTDDQLRVVGDTRFDRVHQRSIKAKESNLIKNEFLKDKKIIVAGSTWSGDEEILLPVFVKLTKHIDNLFLIIAPHEPTLLHIENIENELYKHIKTIRFSNLRNYKNEKVIIVDSIGILLTLYSYADVAYVGGGFKTNVHNVLEAAVYGVPVLFGPKINNSQEAKELLQRGGGILVKDKKDLYRHLRILFKNNSFRKEKADISFKYVQENLGATKKILNEIIKVL